MSQISDYTTELILVVVVGAIIGAIFLGNILSAVQGESGKQATISSSSEMQKLILYNSMIAYGCDEGGWIQDAAGAAGYDKFWGDRDDLMRYAEYSSTISFEDLNSSMPRVFKGLPCYGTGSTLPGSGTYAENNPYVPVSKEWRDDQEGTYSRIRFEINDSGVELPKCFVHHTGRSFLRQVGVGAASPIAAQLDTAERDEVTNSWFLMSKADQHSVFLRGGGWNPSNSVSCKRMVGSGSVDPASLNQEKGGGPAMNVEVILSPSVSSSISTSGTSQVDGVGKFDSAAQPLEVKTFSFDKGTKGYVQTNTGCKNKAPIHSTSDPPGVSEEIGEGDKCDNTLHPFIVITDGG